LQVTSKTIPVMITDLVSWGQAQGSQFVRKVAAIRRTGTIVGPCSVAVAKTCTSDAL